MMSSWRRRDARRGRRRLGRFGLLGRGTTSARARVWVRHPGTRNGVHRGLGAAHRTAAIGYSVAPVARVLQGRPSRSEEPLMKTKVGLLIALLSVSLVSASSALPLIPEIRPRAGVGFEP